MQLLKKLAGTEIILASGSPRRQELLSSLGIPFRVMKLDVEEQFPDKLQRESIPLFLSRLKAEEAKKNIQENQLIITADTVVWLGDHVLNKPADLQEARWMLNRLSGKTHEVITAVSLTSSNKSLSFYVVTEVVFRNLSEDEIMYYTETYKPLDKAGAYGIQEWIGLVGVERIEGSYFNVMGLPTKELFEELLAF
jgi:septum formation protein